MLVRIDGLRMPPGYTEEALSRAAADRLGCRPAEVRSVRPVRRSLDARRKKDIHYAIRLEADVSDGAAARALKRGAPGVVRAEPETIWEPRAQRPAPGTRVLVAGLGPAGLFAALALAECGFAPLVIERGRPIGERVEDVERSWASGTPDPESNILFGEGGAGTFSDGKLTSRGKDPRSGYVLERLVRAGAPESVLYDAKPHIGTDRLRGIVRGVREGIAAAGGEVRFGTRLAGVRTGGGRLEAAVLEGPAGEETVPCGDLVLAIGQGARDTLRALYASGVRMRKKPFAMGVRVEHPQAMIDRSQFGDACGDPFLGAAEYRLAAEVRGRGVYSFCMCPGGFVVASASEPGGIVVNGMSYAARNGRNANAAIVAQVEPEDMPEGDLGGIDLCDEIERRAFLAGGGTGRAPAETLGDFLRREPSPKGFGAVEPSYRPGVVPADLWQVLPRFVSEAIAEAFPVFGRQIEGFDREDAVLTAVESRTSAPYRIERDASLQAIGIRGLYPVGEGAGYAGGIVSSAVDGIRAAERILAGGEPEGGDA